MRGDPVIGQTLGHYRILSKLGSGGMGEVYEAEDTRLGRKIALKVLPHEVADDAGRRERFEREAKAIAALNHPNIVTIHSVEESGGTHFITMELVEGKPLTDSIPRYGLRLEQLLEIALPLADAVSAAHQQGITHRDLKPDNIIVGRNGRVKVLDFGLAKIHDAPDVVGVTHLPTKTLTEEGKIVGTVSYMSPEQAEGKTVDPRSDVFSLGIILYEMSTGQRPFQGDSAVSILSSILKDTPKSISDLNREMPRELGRIVNRCLSKDPKRRFQSALGLSSELATLKEESDSGELSAVSGAGAEMSGGNRNAAAGGSTITGSRPVPSSGETAASGERAARPHIARMVFYFAAFTVVAGLVFAGFVILTSRDRGEGGGSRTPGIAGRVQGDTRARDRIAVLPFENLGAPEDEYFAAGVTEEITSRLASIRSLGVISRSSALQYANTGKSMREIGRELGVDYVLEGTVRWDRRGDSSRVRVTPQLIRVADDTNLWSDRYDREMEDIFDVQSEIATKVVEELGLAVMRPEERKAISARPTDNLEAYQAYLRGQEKNIFGSREETELAIRMYERAVNLDPGFALAWADLSKTHSAMYHWMIDPTEGRLAKARESADMALRLDPDLLESHLALAYYYYWGRKDYDQALEAISAAGESWKNDSEVLQAVGYIQRRQGKWDESIENLEMAFQLSPREAMLPNQIGQTYQSLRRYPEAIRYFDRAISIAPDKSEHYGAKALAYLGWTGDPEAARRIMAEAPGSDVPGMTLGLMWLDTMAGDYDRVLETLDDYPEEVFESQDTFVPKALFRGLIYLGKDDPDSARSACQEALARLREEIEKRPRDPRVRSALATALACAGFKDEAVREARLTVDIYSVSSDAMAGPAFLGRLAEVYALVGEDEAALDLLDRLLDMPAGAEATVVALHPVWSSFRDNPRFRQILAKPR